MPREDALAVKEYLMHLEPVRANVQPNALMFPFDQRWTIVFWNLFNNPDRRFKADDAKSDAYNRGDYLSERSRSLRRMPHAAELHDGIKALEGVRW